MPGTNTSVVEVASPLACGLSVSEDTLTVNLTDGRSISVPLAWFPRLLHATSRERRRWRLIGRGQGIHWPDVEEDISVSGLLAGRRSFESRGSFSSWLAKRTKRLTKRSPKRGRPRRRAEAARHS